MLSIQLHKTPLAASYQHHLDGLQAFIVEDDAHSLVAISNALSEFGATYKRNTTGLNVVDQITKCQPDFVLLNLDLPFGDPVAIREHLNNTPTTTHIPVIAVADANSFVDDDWLEAHRFSALLTKPIPRSQLPELIHTVLDEDESAARFIS